MTTIYGIKNCDTMKKAIKWLNENGVEHQFHDFKKQGLEQSLLESWVKQVGWETLVNRRGLTWRKLPETDRENIDETQAIKLMMANLSLIKRPVLSTNDTLYIGFKTDNYATIFA